MASLIVLVASSLANIILALVVYIKDPQGRVNRTFAGLTLSLVGLAFATYLSLHTAAPLPYIRLTMIFAALLVTVFKWFSLWYPNVNRRFARARWAELLAALAVIGCMVSPLTFSGVQIAANGNVQPTFRPGIAAFFVLFVYMVGTGLWTLVRRRRLARGKERAQLNYMVIATVFLFSAEFISSLIVPLMFKVSIGVALSPLYYAIFAAVITTAIVKRQLFDIRAVVARSVAYLLLLATLIIAYAVVLFVLSALFFSGDKISHLYQAINMLLAILLAFTFPYLKRYFDHLTERIFYRRAYESQQVIRQLTDLLVSKALLDTIMSRSLDILGGNIEISRALFVVLDRGQAYRIKPYGDTSVRTVDMLPLKHLHVGLATVGEIHDRAARALLTELDMDMVVRLQTPEATIGFLLIGPKSSGAVYSAQDLELLQIASKELAVAVHNALSYEKIGNFNKTLQERVQRATRELRKSNDKLKALDETKDEFISMASHQLRTPLTSVKGYLSMVLEGDVGKLNAQQKQLLTQSYASAQRMVYLISDLLNLSRLSTGKFVIEPVPTSLGEVVQSEIEQLQETAKSRDVTLEFKRPATFPTLLLDETKIHQVVMNFMDNAIYYTPPGGQVVVTLSETTTAVEFSVRDNGIGVPKPEQHKLFSKFYRAGNARKARPDGTGLGLFMAKKVIAASGGALVFESEEGKGSTFGFRFSKAKHAVAAGSPRAQSAELAKV